MVVKAEVLGNLDDCVSRFDRVEERRSAFRPRDMALERFERERFVMIGRPSEVGGASGAATAPYSVVYLKVEPGKGFASHAHDSHELFVFLSGIWEMEADGQTVQVGAWDVATLPPRAWHALKNVGPNTAWVAGINFGNAGPPIKLAPEVLEELRQLGDSAPEVELPPGADADR